MGDTVPGLDPGPDGGLQVPETGVQGNHTASISVLLFSGDLEPFYMIYCVRLIHWRHKKIRI